MISNEQNFLLIFENMNTLISFYGIEKYKLNYLIKIYRYTASMKNRSYQLRNVFKRAFPHLIRGILFCPLYTES